LTLVVPSGGTWSTCRRLGNQRSSISAWHWPQPTLRNSASSTLLCPAKPIIASLHRPQAEGISLGPRRRAAPPDVAERADLAVRALESEAGMVIQRESRVSRPRRTRASASYQFSRPSWSQMSVFEWPELLVTIEGSNAGQIGSSVSQGLDRIAVLVPGDVLRAVLNRAIRLQDQRGLRC